MYFVFSKETKKSKKSRRRGSREQREKDRAEVNSSEFKTFEIFNRLFTKSIFHKHFSELTY